MFDIDLVLEAAKEDPQTYRDLSKFARENPAPARDRNAEEQARRDANKGSAMDARDVKRVNDYAKVGGVTTMGDLAAKYEQRRTAARALAMATAKVERALGYQNEKGDDINVKNARATLDKSLAELLDATKKASSCGILNASQSGSMKEFIKDCRELDVDDDVEMNSKLRELISDTNRWKIPMLTKTGEKMVSIASLVPDSSRPQPLNTPFGSEKAAWLANQHASFGDDKRSETLKKIDQAAEEKSYKKMKDISYASQELRDGIRSGKIPEGTTLKSYLERKAAKAEQYAKDNDEPVNPKNTNALQALSTKERLSALHIPTMEERPVEGCTNVKALVRKWASEHKQPAGQIEIVYGARHNNEADHKNVVVTKPVIWISGNYYQVPKNDLFTTAKNGIAMDNDKDGKPNPYKGYVKGVKQIDKKKHGDIIAKLKGMTNASVDTEEDTVEEAVTYFEY